MTKGCGFRLDREPVIGYVYPMTTTAAPYQPGQSVEVFAPNFRKAGMPREWFPGTVEAVSVMDETKRLFNVQVRMTEDNRPHVETVGPRGGNKRIRKA